jgi:hypothetical protein
VLSALVLSAGMAADGAGDFSSPTVAGVTAGRGVAFEVCSWLAGVFFWVFLQETTSTHKNRTATPATKRLFMAFSYHLMSSTAQSLSSDDGSLDVSLEDEYQADSVISGAG